MKEVESISYLKMYYCSKGGRIFIVDAFLSQQKCWSVSEPWWTEHLYVSVRTISLFLLVPDLPAERNFPLSTCKWSIFT